FGLFPNSSRFALSATPYRPVPYEETHPMLLGRHGLCFGSRPTPERAGAMLRITVHDKPGALTFQLEGSLAGPWVQVLKECWQSALACQRQSILRVDLTEVTFIDAAGKACLAALHRLGAEFVAADCLSKAIVDEITHRPKVGGQKAEGKHWDRVGFR